MSKLKESTLSSKVRRRLAADLAQRRDGFVQRMAGSAAAHPTDPATGSGHARGAGRRRPTGLDRSIAQLELELKCVEAALQRIDSGAFGTCCRCGLEIEPRWLEKDPATAFCAVCCEELAMQRGHRRAVS